MKCEMHSKDKPLLLRHFPRFAKIQPQQRRNMYRDIQTFRGSRLHTLQLDAADISRCFPGQTMTGRGTDGRMTDDTCH